MHVCINVCVCGGVVRLSNINISGHKGHPNCKSTDPNTNSFGQVQVTFDDLSKANLTWQMHLVLVLLLGHPNTLCCVKKCIIPN